MGDDRPPVYYEDDVLIIRASAIGTSCLWELVAAGQGYEASPVPPAIQRAFDDGHELEPVVIGMLEADGWQVFGQQDEGHLDLTPNIRVRFHPDGYITQLGYELRILEVKTFAESTFAKAARHSVGAVFEEYKWQISVMMWANATGLVPMPALWVAYSKADGSLMLEKVDTPPIDLATILHKATQIKELVDGEDIMASGRPCDDPTHFPCRFLHIRPEPDNRKVTLMPDDDGVIDASLSVEGDTAERVDYLVKEYLMNKGIVDEAKAKQEAAKEELIELSRNHKRIITDKWIVPVVQGTNTSPDWAAMPQELKQQVDQYKKSTKYKYLRDIKPQG